MIGFYYGTSIPGTDAKEGIYFVKNNNKYSIYTKRKNEEACKYGETNELTSANLDALWTQIGETFVAKTFTVAGLSFKDNITLSQMQEALKLKALAYKDNTTGTLTDYVTEVQGVNYVPTGTVEVILGYEQTAIISRGAFTPKGQVNGTVVAKGNVALQKDSNGFAISGSVSAPDLTIIPNTETIKQITGIGTLPSYHPAEYTAPSLESSTNAFTTEGVTATIEGSVLKLVPAATANAVTDITFDKGAYVAASFNPGTLPTIDDSLSVVTSIPTASASKPVFTGDKIKAVFTGISSDINAEFTGTQDEIEVSGQYNQAIVESATFSGNNTVLKPELTKVDKTVTIS